MPDQLQALWRKYRAEWLITIATTLISVLATLIVGALTGSTARILLTVFVAALVLLLLFGSLFNLKRLVNSRFSQVSGLLSDYFGLPAIENQYFTRRRHFATEKALLARELVKKLLPAIIDNARHDQNGVGHINIVLDSGTTITPIFPLLFRLGIPNLRDVPLRVFTNNLAGIDEIHRIDPNEICVLAEDSFRLIGGTPLSMYRATTGNETQESLKIFLQEPPHSGCQITIGVLTANWFLVGAGLDRISLCARGRGHHDFKRFVVENSHYVLLVAPLGKILPLNSVDELNSLIQGHGDPYTTITPDTKKTVLLTSFRPQNSLSPLAGLAQRLKYIQEHCLNSNANYTICKFCPSFEPPGGQEEVAASDLPHEYIRSRSKQIFF